MTPSRQVVSPADITKVNVCLRSDMSYWTRVLGVSELALRQAVRTVGENSWDVRAELRRRRS
ncbi:Protein of unknown function [Luteibacter sp. UNC138MFCol5.1]|nr:Protein of unknown function [Luteibacter sp. UNC138MFCol5.1]